MTDQKPESLSVTDFFKSHPGLSDLPVESTNELAQSRAVEGVLVDDDLKANPFDFSGLPTVSVDGWLSYMDSKPSGFDSVLKDFLLDNPQMISLEAPVEDSTLRISQPREQARISPASPRQWEQLSRFVQSANTGSTNAQAGKEWAFPAVGASGIASPELSSAITQYAKNRGIMVVNSLDITHSATRIDGKGSPLQEQRQPKIPVPDEPSI